VLETFQKLQATFARRESFLLRPQEQQQQLGGNAEEDGGKEDFFLLTYYSLAQGLPLPAASLRVGG
jgi:hypothetical protein